MAVMESNEPYNRVFDGTGAIVGAVGGGVMTGGALLLSKNADKTYEERVNKAYDIKRAPIQKRAEKHAARLGEAYGSLQDDFFNNLSDYVGAQGGTGNQRNPNFQRPQRTAISGNAGQLQAPPKAIITPYNGSSNNLPSRQVKGSFPSVIGNHDVVVGGGSNTRQETGSGTGSGTYNNSYEDEKHQRAKEAVWNSAKKASAGKSGKFHYNLLKDQYKLNKSLENINNLESERQSRLTKGSFYSRHLGGGKNALAVGAVGAIGAVAGGFITPALRRMDEQQ